jgi:lipopolysaccharide biosynthesis protein
VRADESDRARRTDFAYLEASRMALLRAGLRASRAPPRQAQRGLSERTLAVIVHAFYPDIFEDLVEQFCEVHREFKNQIKLFVSAPRDKVATIRVLLEQARLPYELIEVENRGRDIAPFLTLARQAIDEGFEYLLKLHTKKSPHRGDGARWRDDMYRCLGTASQVRWIVSAMRKQPHVGIVAPAQFVVPLTRNWEHNRARVQWLAQRLGIPEVDPGKEMFVAGTMFFARPAALEPLLNLALRLEDFEPEDGSVDGTMAHAMERAITFSTRAAGLGIALAQIAKAKEDQMLIPAA